ncbi:unnamed protein product [Trichobilharzia regenti]|nr:unnamed protein product [Trichobilharzia regenti]
MCDDNGVVKKPVVATGKILSNRVSQNRATISESSCDSTSLQGIASQSEGIKSLRICEEELKLSAAANKQFENDEVDQIDDGKVNICGNDHDG